MLGFPTPYPNELLYSVIARAGIYDGETSPKQLLDSIFNNRKVIATVDLPSHIKCIASKYPETLGLSIQELIHKHTMWPLYAPFIPEFRRTAIEKKMRDYSHGSIHLASGIAASKVKSQQVLLICPSCIENQLREFGECYWDRHWQIPLIKTCFQHGALYETNVKLRSIHRHAFVAASNAEIRDKLLVSEMDYHFERAVRNLFSQDVMSSPTYNQWKIFYRKYLLTEYYQLGNRPNYDEILAKYNRHWGTDWLIQSNLLPTDKETTWLKAIFRKHRRAFSFAEHATVIEALTGALTVPDAIKKAHLLPKENSSYKKVMKTSLQASNQEQSQWLSLLKEYGSKKSRQKNSALYARLYRHQYDWLMCVNAKYALPTKHVNTRVDWKARDKKSAKILRNVIYQIDTNLSMPRVSKSYLLSQLPNSSSIEKNIKRLPRCQIILNKFSESIIEYQARRLTVAILKYKYEGKPLKRWSLLREAGLSDERIIKVVDSLLREVLTDEA